MAGASLGMTISIPDQVVLVGGTGRHLSDRFSFTPDVYVPTEQDGRFASSRLPNVHKTAQSRLGPPATIARRSGGYDDGYEDDEENIYGVRERQHVLKRLGNPLTNSSYGRWNNNYGDAYGPVAYTPGQVGRGRRGGGYQNSSYRGSGTPFARYGGYNPYGYYTNNSHSYNQNYTRPRYPNYNNYYTSPYSFRGYNNYRGRYNNYSQRFNRSRRGGRYGKSNREPISKDDLDRDLDEFRNGVTKKENSNGDINL